MLYKHWNHHSIMKPLTNISCVFVKFLSRYAARLTTSVLKFRHFIDRYDGRCSVLAKIWSQYNIYILLVHVNAEISKQTWITLVSLISESLPPDMMGKSPLCMAQYFKLLCSNRIPHPVRDEQYIAPRGESKHIVVAHKNQVGWRLDILPVSWLDHDHIKFSFQFIVSCVWYSMEKLAGDLLLGSKFVQLSILPTLFIHFVQSSLGELRIYSTWYWSIAIYLVLSLLHLGLYTVVWAWLGGEGGEGSTIYQESHPYQEQRHRVTVYLVPPHPSHPDLLRSFTVFFWRFHIFNCYPG